MKVIETIKSHIRRLSSRPLLFTVLLLALSVGAAYVTDRVVQVVGIGQIVEANDQYLEGSFKKSGVAFLSLSAIKAAVAIIEGSTIGVSFGVAADLQVGDSVQSIYDFVDMAWKITFFSSTILYVVRLLLFYVSSLGPLAMLGVFLSGALVLAIQNWRKDALLITGIFRRVFRFFMVCTVGIYIALPVTVGAARLLSSKISAPAIDEGLQNVTALRRDADQLGEEVLTGRVKIKETLAKVQAWSVRLFEKGLKFCAGFMFDCLIFPGALLLSAWMVLKKCLIEQGVTNHRTIREDIQYALRKIKRDERDE